VLYIKLLFIYGSAILFRINFFFLLQKLEGLKHQDKTQITMIVIWVIELFLNQLGTLRDKGKESSTEYVSLQKELDSFLARPQVTVSFAQLANADNIPIYCSLIY
jgi:hypothetical protein